MADLPKKPKRRAASASRRKPLSSSSSGCTPSLGGGLPAARAAVTRYERAKRVSWSPVEIPRSAARSRPPYDSRAQAGPEARSKAAITPRADSIGQSGGTPGARSATQPTSAPDSTFGMRSPSTDPAIASRSRAHVSLRALLTRTQHGREAAASATIARARSFMSGGTASSRSSSTTSAPASNTRRKSFSLCPGAKSQLRGERVTPPPARLGNVFTDELARNHRPKDVVGAFADRHQRRIPIEALDLIFGRIAVAAVDAHRLQRCFDADLRGVQLRHPGFEVGPPPRVERRCRPPGQQARRLHLGRHVRELQLDRLELGNRPAERVALARVSQGPVQARLSDAHRTPRDVDASKLERRQRLLQPVALLPTQQVLHRDVTVAEEDL